MGKKYILPNSKLQFFHNNIFPHVSVCQNSDEIKATDPHNVKDVFFFLFFVFVFVSLYLQVEIYHRKHHHAHTLDFTNLLVKLWNLCSWKIWKAKWHFSVLDMWFRSSSSTYTKQWYELLNWRRKTCKGHFAFSLFWCTKKNYRWLLNKMTY